MLSVNLSKWQFIRFISRLVISNSSLLNTVIESTPLSPFTFLFLLKSLITRHSLIVVWMIQLFKIRMSQVTFLSILTVLLIRTVIGNVNKSIRASSIVLQLMCIEAHTPIMSFILIRTELRLKLIHVKLSLIIIALLIR
jgi:hypothetical protein